MPAPVREPCICAALPGDTHLTGCPRSNYGPERVREDFPEKFPECERRDNTEALKKLDEVMVKKEQQRQVMRELRVALVLRHTDVPLRTVRLCGRCEKGDHSVHAAHGCIWCKCGHDTEKCPCAGCTAERIRNAEW